MTDPASGTSTPSATAAPPAPPPRTAVDAGPGDDRPRRRGGFARVVKWAVALILLVVIGGALFVYLYLDRIVKRTVETQASAQLNLKTELDSAHVSLLGGRVSLDELRIASPQGFVAPQMFTLGEANVKASVGELRGDPVRVATITLNQPKLVMEYSGGKFNFKRAMELMPQQPQKPADQSQPLKVVIGELTVKDPTVVVRPGKINIPGLNLKEEYLLSIPTISMKNIGTGEGSENGAAIKEVVMQVVSAMAAQAANSGQLPADLQNLLNVDVQQVVAGLTAEARKRVAEALPGEAGRIVNEVLADPQAFLKNPGEAIGTQVEQLKGQAQAEAEKRIGGALDRIGIGGAGTTQPSTQPATQPVDRARQEAENAINRGLGGLLNRDKKDERKDRDRKDR